MVNNRKSESPDLMQVLQLFKDIIFGQIYCHLIGRIQTFNPTTQTASIEILFKKAIINTSDIGDTGTILDPPLLVECPVVILGNTTANLQLPINVGDECIVLFIDKDIDNWVENGAASIPNTLRKHDFADGIALVGVRNQTKAIQGYDNDAASLNYNATKIRLKDKITIQNAAENLKIIMDDFIDVLKGLTTTGGFSLIPTVIVDLDTIKARLDTILE